MLIIGCDLHTRYQVIAMLDTMTGEIVTRRLEHENGEARAFYAPLLKPALIGIEATGYTQWSCAACAVMEVFKPSPASGSPIWKPPDAVSSAPKDQLNLWVVDPPVVDCWANW